MFKPVPAKPTSHAILFLRAAKLLPGSKDGKWIFESVIAALKNKNVAQAA